MSVLPVNGVHEAGLPIPATKIGVLDAVIRLAEQSDEHRNHLQQPPLSARARDYLGELAARMTAQGGVNIAEDKARPAVVYVAKRLKDAGLIAGASDPDPGSILGMLSAHHVLERQDYPETAFRFEHQQFQEFYAAVGAGKRLLEALPEGQDDKRREFARLYVNEPSWAEPLRLIADDIRGRSGGANGAGAVQAGTLLISMALLADPVFAAELSYLCGPLVWQEVRPDVGDRLRELYAGGSHYRNLALTGMLASGSDDFRDILEPILSGNDQQQVLRLYRRWDRFNVSSLGPSWQKTVSGWDEEARIAFVSENLHHRNDPEITALALADPSNKVKDAAIQGLTWIGAEEDAARFLSSLDAPTFDHIAASLPPDFVPIPVRDRVIAVLEKSHDAEANPIDRVSSLLKLRALGAFVSIDQLKSDLDGVTGKIDGHRAHYVIEPALTIVRFSDASWASAWIAVRVADGSLWHEPWGEMVTTAPESLRQAILQKLETENLSNSPFGNAIAVLAPGADAALADRIFKKLCEIRQVIAAAPDQRHEFERAIERQLEALWRALPLIVSVTGISGSFSKPVDGIRCQALGEVLCIVKTQVRNRLATFVNEGVAAIIGSLRLSGFKFGTSAGTAICNSTGSVDDNCGETLVKPGTVAQTCWNGEVSLPVNVTRASHLARNRNPCQPLREGIYPVIQRPNGETPGAIDEAPLRELVIWKAGISRRRSKPFKKIKSEPCVSSEHNGSGAVHVAIAMIVFDGNKPLMKLASGSVAFRESWLDNYPPGRVNVSVKANVGSRAMYSFGYSRQLQHRRGGLQPTMFVG